MKKALIVVLIAFVAVASAFAFEFKSVGIETYQGAYVSADMDIIDNLDVYGRIGYNGFFSFSVGGQYKVYDFKVEGTKIDIKPGAQMNFSFGDNTFVFSLLATCEFPFETGHFGAFLRPGIGFQVYKMKNWDADTNLALSLETGVRFMI